ncbi:uncharacterized protein [Panulirus ornatus]|uniref:uncharacterized protein isoform X2 n=1 Tax=Panulirus ornatus TaxID=150431 RepID=UPI003A85ABD7
MQLCLLSDGEDYVYDEEEESEEVKPKRMLQKRVAAKVKAGSTVGKTTKTKKEKATVDKLEKKTGKIVKPAKATVTTYDIVLDALSSSEDKKGMSLEAIKKYYIIHHPEKEWSKVRIFVKKAMLRGLKEGSIIRAKDSSESLGVKGRFKVNKKHQKPTAKKVKDVSVASESDQSKKKLAKVVDSKTNVTAKEGVVKACSTLQFKKSTKKANEVKEEKASGKENKVPGKQGRPPKNKPGPSVKTASKKPKSVSSKVLKSKTEGQNMSHKEFHKGNRSVPAKSSKKLK